MAHAHREIATARFSVARVLLSLLVCCRCLHGGSRSSRVGLVEAAAGGTTSSSSRQPSLHRHQQWRSSRGSYAPCFVASGKPVQGSRIRGDDGSHGGVGCRSRSRSSSSRVTTMNTTRAKRGAAGRGRSKTGVSKKARRILEPASREETAYEEKKEKVSSMNWGNLGKSGGGGGGGKRGKAGRGQAGPSSSSYGGPAGGAAAASEDAAGLDAAWKEAALPRAGDELKCRHFKACAGCDFDRRFDETPIMTKHRSFMDSLHSTGARARGGAKAASDFEPHVIHPWKPHGWRTLAKLAARPVSKWRGVELGLYSAGSHNVIGIPDCRVHHPSVNLAVKTLQESTKKIGVTGFRQENLDGDLRYMAVERTSGQVQLTLVWNEENYRDATPKLQLLAKDLRSSRPELFHSIWVNFRVGVGNAIFSRDPHSWHRCSGPEYLKEVVGPSKIPFFFSPPLFRQGNLDHFESIVQAVVDWVPEGSGVCELYAGVGVLGLNVAAKAAFVRCSDVNSFNPRSFERSRKTLPPNLRKRVSFEALSADEAMEDGESEGCEVLIVDPPRK
ncbi:unnamed protein product, partial [Ectocarpus sp. 4 AP-2014]